MDITLIRTFLEVAASGTFVGAAERLYVTQSAVSLRIKRLEDALGQVLFVRSKGGASLTASGREFEHYALRLVRVWEESRQQIGLPEGFTRYLNIGAQYALWPRLGYRWIDALRVAMPDLSLRGEVGMPDRITRLLLEGTVQVALLYTPQLRPGLSIRPVMEDELVLVAAQPDQKVENLKRRYVFVDWGEEFAQAHALQLPELTSLGLTLATGSMAGDFILPRGLAAYLPARFVGRYLDSGEMHLVPDAPVFPFPIWSVWRDDLAPDLAERALECLTGVADKLDESQDEVLDDLRDMNHDHTIETLSADHFTSEDP
jgi:DNA-binding transcriptional LysR family regulator